MFIRTQENYRKVAKIIVRLKKDLRIFLSTLFNTGGRDLLGARDIQNCSSNGSDKSEKSMRIIDFLPGFHWFPDQKMSQNQ